MPRTEYNQGSAFMQGGARTRHGFWRVISLCALGAWLFACSSKVRNQVTESDSPAGGSGGELSDDGGAGGTDAGGGDGTGGTAGSSGDGGTATGGSGGSSSDGDADGSSGGTSGQNGSADTEGTSAGGAAGPSTDGAAGSATTSRGDTDGAAGPTSTDGAAGFGSTSSTDGSAGTSSTTSTSAGFGGPSTTSTAGTTSSTSAGFGFGGFGDASTGGGGTGGSGGFDVNAEDFTCLADWAQVSGFRITNLLGQTAAAVAVAENPAGGIYPVGTIISNLPTDAMVKRAAGFSPETNDWEFFLLQLSSEGVTTIADRGTTEIMTAMGATCVSCHSQVPNQFDFVCNSWGDAGSDNCGFDFAESVLEAQIAADPRCD